MANGTIEERIEFYANLVNETRADLCDVESERYAAEAKMFRAAEDIIAAVVGFKEYSALDLTNRVSVAGQKLEHLQQTVNGLKKLVGRYEEKVAGLVAEGVTHLSNIHELTRKYDNLVPKLQAMGAEIEQLPATT